METRGGTPVIGNNCFICTGVKIVGAVHIGNDVVVGANSVVVKSIYEDGVTIGGTPARIISHKDSNIYIDKRLSR